jgi:peptidoglycan hydrolase-like protein with peptidoglycan-binding domain
MNTNPKTSVFDRLGDLARAVEHRDEIEALFSEMARQEPAVQQMLATLAKGRALASVIAPELIAPENYSVEFFQTMLNDVAGAHLTVDGDNGPATSAAVKWFQVAHNLHVDGWVGRETFDALFALWQARAK